MPLMPELGRQKQAISVSSRPSLVYSAQVLGQPAIHSETLSQNKCQVDRNKDI